MRKEKVTYQLEFVVARGRLWGGGVIPLNVAGLGRGDRNTNQEECRKEAQTAPWRMRHHCRRSGRWSQKERTDDRMKRKSYLLSVQWKQTKNGQIKKHKEADEKYEIFGGGEERSVCLRGCLSLSPRRMDGRRRKGLLLSLSLSLPLKRTMEIHETGCWEKRPTESIFFIFLEYSTFLYIRGITIN